MRNPLQEQLLKAGLVKKSKVAEVAREQAKARHGKAPPAPSAEQAEAERIRPETAERNAQARLQEQRAQVRQIVEQNRLKPEGDIDYRFTHDGTIRSVLVTTDVRRQLASGALVIVRHDPGYALIPRAAADKIESRDASMIVLDHARTPPPASDASEDEHYARFKVPDDLIW